MCLKRENPGRLRLKNRDTNAKSCSSQNCGMRQIKNRLWPVRDWSCDADEQGNSQPFQQIGVLLRFQTKDERAQWGGRTCGSSSRSRSEITMAADLRGERRHTQQQAKRDQNKS